MALFKRRRGMSVSAIGTTELVAPNTVLCTKCGKKSHAAVSVPEFTNPDVDAVVIRVGDTEIKVLSSKDGVDIICSGKNRVSTTLRIPH